MAMEGESSKARGSRPCREWEQDPLCFAHVRLLAFDLLALRPVPHMPDVAPSPVHGDYLCHVVVDDGTGCVPCIFWTNYASFPATSPAKGLELRSRQEMAIATTAKVKLGDLLRVQGRLNTYTNQIQVTVASLRTEKDPNAEVLHWVECMRLAKCCYDLDPSLQKRPLVP
nr:CST complex subunit STN1-like isoform X3 [Physcomitrium patens]|eukprot:XP_024362065.1 CST complex subunit STN1-like isoform X3 [Physcomitrella patens]